MPQQTSPLDQLNGKPPQGSPLLGFLQPEETEPLQSETIPSPASSPETSDAPEQASGPDYDEASDPSELPAGTRSTASRAGSNPLVGAGLKDMFRNGVIIASHQAHSYLGRRTQGQAEVQLFLADEQDAAGIGDPLARIAERRDGVGQMSPDTADLMAAMMGLAGYASKQIQKNAIAQKIDQRNAGAEAIPDAEDLS